MCPDGDSEAAPFSLWSVPGQKALYYDGSTLSVCAEIDQQVIRLDLDEGVTHGCPFAFHIPARAEARKTWLLASSILSPPDAHGSNPLESKPTRPPRSTIAHLRTLQALDGAASDASHREIAQVIFGARDVFERWHTDSELRAQVRYLLRRGERLVNGGYRELLKANASDKGE